LDSLEAFYPGKTALPYDGQCRAAGDIGCPSSNAAALSGMSQQSVVALLATLNNQKAHEGRVFNSKPETRDFAEQLENGCHETKPRTRRSSNNGGVTKSGIDAIVKIV
jgi:hypothetical protein